MSPTPHDHTVNTLQAIRDLTRKNKSNPLTGREYHVLITLLTYRNNISFKCNPQMSTLAKDMQCARSSVQSAIEGLRKKDYIRSTSNYNPENMRKMSNQYWITYDLDTVKKAFSEEESKDYFYAYHDNMIEKYEAYLLKYENKVYDN